MPSKKHTKSANKRRNARGPTTDELNRMEKGEIAHSKPNTPPPAVPFYRVSPKSMPKYNSMLPLPEGFDSAKLLKNTLRNAERQQYKPKTHELVTKLPDFVTAQDVFANPPPEVREELRRAASAELREANLKMEAKKIVEENRFVPDEKKRTFLNPFGLGKKSRKGKKSRRKSKKHSTRRK